MYNDTRHFLLPHVHKGFDYGGIRGIDTSLNVRIPQPFTYTGRDVCAQSQRFELSLNALSCGVQILLNSRCILV